MDINMNGLRAQLIGAVNNLARELEDIEDQVYSAEYGDLAKAFDEVAQHADTLCCIYNGEEKSFTDISHEYSAVRLSGDD